MIYKLIEADSPSLMVKLPDTSFDDIKTKYDLTPQELYDNLKGTMAAMRGIGLSANQCGLSVRAFVMYTDLKEGNVEIYFNPKIIWQSEETDYFVEGCLTYPHLFLNLKRPNMIEFEYMDINGEQKTGKFAGLTARIFQHEYDHMEGKNFTMYASKLKLDMAKKKAAKKLKKVTKTS